jgi:hypothetical protein
MDGALDDPLARLHRWEALRQKLAVSRGTRLDPVVDEVVAALGEVVQRNSAVSLTVVVEDAQAEAGVRLAWNSGRVTATRIDLSTEPEPADTAATDRPPRTNGAGPPPSNHIAAQLAELIRRDPSLLEDLDDRGSG